MATESVFSVKQIAKQFKAKYKNRLVCIESHTEGEKTRIVIDGIPELLGETMTEKMFEFKHSHDNLRTVLTSEPRTGRDMIAVVVTKPTSPNSKFGILYMDAKRHVYLCGHATMGAISALIEAGSIELAKPWNPASLHVKSSPSNPSLLSRMFSGFLSVNDPIEDSSPASSSCSSADAPAKHVQFIEDTIDDTVFVDTVSGQLKTRVKLKHDLDHKENPPRVLSVAINMVPSFVYETNKTLNVPGLGELVVDTVCVGGFFVMVDASQLGLQLTAPVENDCSFPYNIPRTTATPNAVATLGMAILNAANQQLSVAHPLRAEVNTVDAVEIYAHVTHCGSHKFSSIGYVVYGEAHVDRSPCGTGTAAKLTLLHHQNEVKVGDLLLNYGPLDEGRPFEGRIVDEVKIGHLRGVVVEVSGAADTCGLSEFWVDENDPYPTGFLM